MVAKGKMESRHFEEMLLKSKTSRDFLAKIAGPNSQMGYSYAEFARLCGFASRSFVRSLTTGERAFSLDTGQKIAHGLKFKSDSRNLLIKMIELDRSTDPKYTEKSESQLIRLRSIVKKKLCKPKSQTKLPKLPSSQVHEWPILYAALGASEEGIDLQSISKRARTEPMRCHRILSQMIKAGLISYNPKSERYKPTASFLSFRDLGGQAGFEKFYLFVHGLVAQKLAESAEVNEQCFYASVFSVRKEELKEISKTFQETLESFSNKAESSDGEELVFVHGALIQR